MPSIAAALTVLRRRLRGFRDSFEIAGGLLAGNLFDTINMLVISAFSGYLVRQRGLLAVYPQLSALAGGLMLSQASRAVSLHALGAASTEFYLGGLAVSAAAGILLTAIFSSVTAVAIGLEPLTIVAAALVSLLTVLSLLTMFTWGLIVLLLRLGASPDNVLPAILTSIIDTVVLILAIFAFSTISRLGSGLLLVAIVTLSLALGFTAALYDVRLTIDTSISNLALQLIEMLAGIILSITAPLLAATGLLPVLPPLNKLAGSVAGSMASAATTSVSLYGHYLDLQTMISSMFRATVGAIPSALYIGVVGYILASGGDSAAGLQTVIATLVVAVLLSLVGSLLAWLLVAASIRAGLDPDAIAMPLATSIIDLMGVLSLSAAAWIILSF
ncbi:magnesium transporter [Aeropyrum camini]|uniref:Permease n=1 Tax=Aeropyrum camini SY1 = JCM 12091 TaxID=1198449 RepID=U3T7U5_9CREN|nr:magnesium transporter [Aeropyrum camini]BAN89592.1 permease [Aeropyrum camini SY1 = JCM 12091]